MKTVCLIIEGTYPFSSGGVSSWTQTLITKLPEIEFSVLHLHAGPTPQNPIIKPPDNLTKIITHPVYLDHKLMNLENLITKIPEAQIYHALSTGIAGFLGTEIKRRFNKPFILTEHGIYWHEIELGTNEIECGFKIIDSDDNLCENNYSRAEWASIFREYALDTYKAADSIMTVSGYNNKMQIQLGAEADKCKVISNGVDINYYDNIYKKKSKQESSKIGLVGRITSIKDIKNFIKACNILSRKLPDCHFYIIGPTDHDPEYFEECASLVERLNLKNITFTGEVNPAEYYELLDVVVLSSISEGQPLVLLEAMACGIPVVATDVGGCREIVYGNGDQLGKAGLLCPPDDAASLAQAIYALSVDAKTRNKYANTGRNRVHKFYSDNAFISAYQNVYSNYF